MTLDLTLSGPSPWRARGKATLELWWFSKSISFDRTIGDDEPPAELPAADPLPELVAALADPRNWSARPPDAVVTLRDTPLDGDVLLHPLGDLAVSQRVVPLGIDIDRFGSAAVAGDRRFDVAVVGPDGTAATRRGRRGPLRPRPSSSISATPRSCSARRSSGWAPACASASVAPTWGGQDDEALIADAALGYETVVMTTGRHRTARPRPVRRHRATTCGPPPRSARSPAARPVTPAPARYRTGRRVTGSTRAVVDGGRHRQPLGGRGARSRRRRRSYTAARQALDRHVAAHPELAGRLQVVDGRRPADGRPLPLPAVGPARRLATPTPTRSAPTCRPGPRCR